MEIIKADIVIPIYNAYEDLKKCVASIVEYTDLSRHRLILVNDASSDERIPPYLNSIKSENVIVYNNIQNLGFAGSINKGIQLALDRDVLLLNSDTIVTRDWLEKIVVCAYSDDAIGSVTPLSNNATLCSVPEFLQNNPLPEGYTIQKFSDLVETYSLKKYPRIPVANGFCMFVKRDVFNKIGHFDAETFGRGYGEENDFCYRAIQAGYHHVMCDNTFVYHSGTSSFADKEKKKYIEDHERILRTRYPDLNHDVAVHCQDNPNEIIQTNIKLWLELKNQKRNLLYLVQADFRLNAHDHIGGTQLHVKDLVQLFCKEYNVFVAARDLDYLNLTAYIDNKEYFFRFYIGPPHQYTQFHSKMMKDMYEKILSVFHISLVHIHHTKDLSLELYYQAQIRKIPVVTTLHDYYSICPSIKMADSNGALCVYQDSPARCAHCQSDKWGIFSGTDYIRIWREEYLKILKMSYLLVTPSHSSKLIINHYYPEVSDKIQVIEHGITHFKRSNQIRICDKKFRAAFIGGISPEKGSDICIQLIKKGPKDIEWHLFGTDGFNDLSIMEQKNYIKHGYYEREALPKLLLQNQIDLICILPIWPETYCYTLSEAVASGIPVIATDIGALGERVRKLNCGWLVPVNNIFEEVSRKINQIKDKGTEYQERVNIVKHTHLKTLNEMGNDYRELYNRALPELENWGTNASPQENLHWAIDGHLIAMGKQVCWQESGYLIQERMNLLDQELSDVKNSTAYKCTVALNNISIPGKQHIKKILYKVYKLLKHK